jgi:hypothetical protein
VPDEARLREHAQNGGSRDLLGMDPENRLRLAIRRKLAAGTLPHDTIARIWGGAATGEACDACEQLIMTDQFVIEGITTEKRGVQFHAGCFALWDEERDVPGRER